MEFYDLTIYQTKSMAVVATYPPTTTSFGSFSAGDFFDLRPAHGLWKIDRVGHSIIQNATSRLHKTMLLVSPETSAHP